MTKTMKQIRRRNMTDINAGDIVYFMGASREQIKWGGTADPRGILVVGDKYEVTRVEEHSMHTRIYLKGIEDKYFNSVCFIVDGSERLEDKRKMQAMFCTKHMIPRFAPSNGICFTCGEAIYERITFREAATTHITGCPVCHQTYCD
jgi:hypothetical protein